MPFGVTNAPAQFMNMMHDLLGEYLNQFVLIFLDDVLIYSANIQEHCEHLRKVLNKLWEHRLYAKPTNVISSRHQLNFWGNKYDKVA